MTELEIELLARYLAGNPTHSEEEKVARWIKSDPENQKLMKEFKRIWEASGEGNIKQLEVLFNAEKDWENFQSRLKRETGNQGGSVNPKYKPVRAPVTQFKARFSQFMRVAAVIIIASLIGLVAYQNINYEVQKPVEQALKEIAMEKGQRGNITLSDGTKVKLNAESKIILPDVFESDKREVRLIGEAYFDVASNPEKPFLIHTDGAVVRILGTSLGIRSYPDDKTIQVVVKEGRVSFSSDRDPVKSNVILTAGELGRLSLKDHKITTEKIEDLELYLSWTDGYLKFRNTPMQEVARQLERKYDIEVKFNNPELKELRLTAALKSRSIRHNLDTISASLEMKYVMDQEVVVFSKK